MSEFNLPSYIKIATTCAYMLRRWSHEAVKRIKEGWKRDGSYIL
jgi:hypothetical protein